MDLEGRILSLNSFKEITRSMIIKHIMDYGKAVILATDVYPPPKMVKKLSSSLNSRIHSPYKVLSVDSKSDLVTNYIEKSSKSSIKDLAPHNAHERDALAAAIYTYKNYQKKWDQITRKGEKMGLSPEEILQVKVSVIQGKPISVAIEEQIALKSSEQVTSSYEHELDEDNHLQNKEEVDRTIKSLKHQLRIQKNQYEYLKEKNRELENKIREQEEELKKMENKFEKLYYDFSHNILYKKEITAKIGLIKKLQEKYNQEHEKRLELEKKLESVQNIRNLEISQKAVPVKTIDSFTREGIKDAVDQWNIKKGDVVYLKNSEGGGSHTAQLIIQLQVKAIITKDKMSHQAEEEFEKNQIPLISTDKLTIETVNGLATVNPIKLDKEITEWNNYIKQKKRQKDKKELLKLIEEYRAQRRISK